MGAALTAETPLLPFHGGAPAASPAERACYHLRLWYGAPEAAALMLGRCRDAIDGAIQLASNAIDAIFIFVHARSTIVFTSGRDGLHIAFCKYRHRQQRHG